MSVYAAQIQWVRKLVPPAIIVGLLGFALPLGPAAKLSWPAQPVAEPSAFFVQLAAVRSSEERARQEGEKLKHRHADILGGVRFVVETEIGRDHRSLRHVLVGPMAEGEARSACAKLRQK